MSSRKSQSRSQRSTAPAESSASKIRVSFLLNDDDEDHVNTQGSAARSGGVGGGGADSIWRRQLSDSHNVSAHNYHQGHHHYMPMPPSHTSTAASTHLHTGSTSAKHHSTTTTTSSSATQLPILGRGSPDATLSRSRSSYQFQHTNQGRLNPPMLNGPFADTGTGEAHASGDVATIQGTAGDRRGVKKKRQRKFVCETCGFGFYTNSDLQKVIFEHQRLL